MDFFFGQDDEKKKESLPLKNRPSLDYVSKSEDADTSNT